MRPALIDGQRVVFKMYQWLVFRELYAAHGRALPYDALRAGLGSRADGSLSDSHFKACMWHLRRLLAPTGFAVRHKRGFGYYLERRDVA